MQALYSSTAGHGWFISIIIIFFIALILTWVLKVVYNRLQPSLDVNRRRLA